MDSRTSGPKESWSGGLGQLRTHWRPRWGGQKARSAQRRGAIQCQEEAERVRGRAERDKERKHTHMISVSMHTDPDQETGTGR